MPKIGCGLDMLDWQEVKRVLQKVLGDTGLQVSLHTLWGPQCGLAIWSEY